MGGHTQAPTPFYGWTLDSMACKQPVPWDQWERNGTTTRSHPCAQTGKSYTLGEVVLTAPTAPYFALSYITIF